MKEMTLKGHFLIHSSQPVFDLLERNDYYWNHNMLENNCSIFSKTEPTIVKV